MSTHSFIAIQDAGGKVRSVYCHFDGYLSHVGHILLNHYDTKEKIHELMNHGDISSLGRNIGEKHDPMQGDKYECTFYRRDYGEKDVNAQNHSSEIEFRFDRKPGGSYVYLFRDGKWYFKYQKSDYYVLTLEDCQI